MEFQHSAEIEAFRTDVRTFIADNLPADWDTRGEAGYDSGAAETTRTFWKAMAQRHWLAMAWPKPYGGLDAPHWQQLVLNEEMAYHRAPGAGGNMGIMWVGPSLILYGTDEQKAQYLNGISRGQDWWCTLYSEPGAGSDLAALQTRAVADGDDYVINGQKIWTSGGHLADWGWLAARTDPDAPKHKGVTMFLVNMKTPGVTVRPLVNMASQHHFNEVFFEDVRIPKKNIVGEVNRGWYHMAVALDFERSGIAAFAGGRRSVESLIDLAKRQPRFLKANAGMRYELADRYMEVQVGTIIAYRITYLQSQNIVANHEASMSKLFGSEMGQRISRTGTRLLGMFGQLMPGNGDLAPQRGELARGYLSSVSGTIAAGTSEIQRNIIATRGLGLPRL